jgi:hypothetical protein
MIRQKFEITCAVVEESLITVNNRVDGALDTQDWTIQVYPVEVKVELDVVVGETLKT